MMRRLTLLIIIIIVTARGAAPADEAAPSPRLEQMRSLARQTDVRLLDPGGEERPAQLVALPVFRYSDEARAIHDSTLWLWTDGSRPAALQKIESSHHRGTGEERWTYCFASLSPQRLRVGWTEDRRYETRKAGLEFHPLPEGPEPAVSPRVRSAQFRQLARRFSAAIEIGPANNDNTQELRLLPRPIFEFGSQEAGPPTGAVFGFATYGTNPDLLLVLELVPGTADRPTWHYAAARMTTGGLILRYGGAPVWSVEHVPPVPQPYDTWTFFFVPRDE